MGTVSIEKSEHLGMLLRKEGIAHEILNAKYHEKEAEIIAQAGRFGAVTIATNMAGRGTDIILGGNAELKAKIELKRQGIKPDVINEATGFASTDDEEILAARKLYTELKNKFKVEVQKEAVKVVEAGGLFIIGTERHESRRIDNQLRGRSGRQGDPGESRFFLSFDDSLIRLFSGERMQRMMTTLGFADDEAIENKMVTNAIERAQKGIEGRNFEIRKNVLQYDDVMNKQREIIYAQRAKVLNGEDINKYIMKMMDETIENTVYSYLPSGIEPEHWNLAGLKDYFLGWLTSNEDFKFEQEALEELKNTQIVDELKTRAHDIYTQKEQQFGADIMRELERSSLLRNVDEKWIDHIDAMHELKRGIHLRSYAQRDPVVEYRLEGFEMFDSMIAAIQEDTVKMLLMVRPVKEINLMHAISQTNAAAQEAAKAAQNQEDNPLNTNIKKVGRNDPCPCGSGLKYKNCHGK